MEASEFQQDKELSDKSSAKPGAYSDHETASIYGKPENQTLPSNEYRGNKSPLSVNSHQITGNRIDTEMMDVPDENRPFGSTPNQKPHQDMRLQPSYEVSSGNTGETSFNKVPPPPINTHAEGDMNMKFRNLRSPSRLSSNIPNHPADPNPTATLIDILTSTICTKITMLLHNNASPEELRHAIRHELAAGLPPATHNQDWFNAKILSQNGSGGQTKPVKCSTCSLELKRPCDLK